eukprot:CAMPEP_0195518084 /NCGR_PEP_ID=MMETSP0794_2-20130614/12165_1 /TAXON_ID=515487 /ORGANISM="Stephanopyxis turris, Strain CCMP 815" /LENGTH=82 /DNA_ID=CAMNT_0040646991 /DNA_START=58 /DNA_END=306 /DNA_ORIENTATION=-
MQNASGQYVDLYVPRKCSWTNRLIHSSDYAAVTVNIARVDADSGQRLPENDTFCLSGYIRSKGEGDAAINALAVRAGILPPL